MPYAKLIPFEEVVPNWPADLFTAPAPGSLGIVGYEIVECQSTTTVMLDIAVAPDLSVSIPGVEGLELVFAGDASNPLRARATLSGAFEASVDGFAALLRIRSPLLIPVEGGPQNWQPVTDANGDPVPLEAEMSIGSVVVDESLHPRFELDQSVSLNHPFVIGATGLVIEASGVRPVLSGNEPPPAGLAPGFRGLAIDQATIHLPDAFALGGLAPGSLTLTGLAIGNGGISGAIGGNWSPVWDGSTASGPGAGELFGMAFGLRSLSIVFSQNAITGAAFDGDLVIPFFDERVAVTLRLGVDGAFHVEVAAAETTSPGPVRLNKPGIGTLELHSLGISRDDDGVAVLISGRLTLEVGSPTLQWPAIEVQALRIGADGKVHLPGGWIDLQQPLALDLFGFGLEISRVGFGTDGDSQRWIGVDGALRLTDLLPAGASARGLRITWDPRQTPAAPALTLDGVGVTFGVADAFAFEGEVALTTTSTGVRLFTGGLGLGLDALDVGIDAGITVGRQATDTYVFVTLGVNVPIPIAATGAALYGLRGLFAMNMAPVVTDADWSGGVVVPRGDWYGWYKHVPDVFTVDDEKKWSSRPGGWAFGAGLSIGTLPDAGFSVNTKALLVVLLPGPVLLLEGKADIFSVPPVLTGSAEGTMSLLAALDGRAGTMQLGIDAAWGVPRLLEIAASTEAFFDFDRADAWHLWIGQKAPASLRIRADYLALFHADAWLMLSAKGIDTGFGVGFGDSWRYGPARVTLEAWIRAQAALSTRPQQLKGQLALAGEASIQAGPFGAGLRVGASLSGQSLAPYEVTGAFSVVVDLPKPLKDLDVEIELEWRQPATPVIDDPWVGALVEHPRCTESWTPMQSTEDAAEDPGAPVVPLDAGILLTFAKPMGDSTEIADNPPSSTPQIAIGDFVATYEVTGLRLRRKRRSHGDVAWEDVSASVFGTWTPDADGAGSRLQLFSRSPFAFTRFTSRRWIDSFLGSAHHWPCEPRPPLRTTCVHWFDTPIGTAMPGMWMQQGATFSSEADLEVLPTSASRGLRLGPVQNDEGAPRSLWIAPPETAADVRLRVVKGQAAALVLTAWSNGRMVATDTQRGMGEFDMQVSAANIDAVTLAWSDAETGLLSVCWTSQASSDAREAWADRRERLESSAERWSSSAPLLEPECHYLLEVTTSARLSKDGDQRQHTVGTHAVQFQTGGPPAIVPSWVPPPASTPNGPAAVFPYGGVLKNLAPYVHATIPARGASPVFRGYDIGCEFDATHVQQMYGADMRIRLRDDNGQPVLDERGREVIFANSWEEGPTATLSNSDAAWLSRLQQCTGAVIWEDLKRNDCVRLASNALLHDDFSGNSAVRWTAFVLDRNERRQPAWTIADGVLAQTVDIAGGESRPDSPDKPGTVFIASGIRVANVAIETTAAAKNGACGIVFRWRGPDDYYRFSVEPDRHRLVRVQDGVASELWSRLTPYTADVPMLLAVQVDGGRVRCQVDELLACDVLVADAGAGGAVGLYCWNSTNVVFEEIRARHWPGPALAPRRAYNAELEATRPLFTDPFHDMSAFDAQDLATGAPATTVSAFAGIAVVAAAPSSATAVVALAGSAAMSDYSVECNARPRASGDFGLVVRHSGPHDYIALLLGPAGRRLLSYCSAGALTRVTTLWHDQEPAAAEHDYAIEVRCVGTSVTVTIDGHAAAAAPTGENGAGRFGMLSAVAGPNGCLFSDLIVRSAPHTAVHGWRFTSSRYLGLPDVLESFAGDVWPVEAAVGDPVALAAATVTAVTAMRSANAAVADARQALAAAVDDAAALELPSLTERARTAVDSRHVISGQQYDLLHQQLGLAWRPVPPVLEISRVSVNGGVVALLIDLAEPLPWERVSWILTASPDGRAAPLSDGALVWSEDGTRALIVRDGAQPFAAGAWKLDLALRLDVGVERPQWRRGGSSAPECGTLSFVLD
jgi:hypothetical protein